MMQLNIAIQVQGSTTAELFERISDIQTTFEDSRCGLCGSTDIRYVVREVDENKFYELKCQKPGCFAKLTFGSPKGKDAGKLYPRRYKTHKEGKDKGKVMRDDNDRAIRLGTKGNGWVRFNRETGEEE